MLHLLLFFLCLDMSGKASGSRFCRIDQLESWPGRVRFSHFFRKMQCQKVSVGPGHCLELGLMQEDAHLKKYKSGISALADGLMNAISSWISWLFSSVPKFWDFDIFRILPIPESDIPEVLKSSWQTANFRPCFIHLGPLGHGWQFLPRHGGDTAASSWDQQRRPRAGGAAGAI